MHALRQALIMYSSGLVQEANYVLQGDEDEEYDSDYGDDSECRLADEEPKRPQYSVNTEPADSLRFDLGDGVFLTKYAPSAPLVCRATVQDLPRNSGALPMGTQQSSVRLRHTAMQPLTVCSFARSLGTAIMACKVMSWRRIG